VISKMNEVKLEATSWEVRLRQLAAAKAKTKQMISEMDAQVDALLARRKAFTADIDAQVEDLQKRIRDRLADADAIDERAADVFMETTDATDEAFREVIARGLHGASMRVRAAGESAAPGGKRARPADDRAPSDKKPVRRLPPRSGPAGAPCAYVAQNGKECPGDGWAFCTHAGGVFCKTHCESFHQ